MLKYYLPQGNIDFNKAPINLLLTVDMFEVFLLILQVENIQSIRNSEFLD